MNQHMSTVFRLKGLEVAHQPWLMNMLGELCRSDPLSAHCYTIYYLTHDPDRTEILLLASGSNIESYALIWYGGQFTIQDVYEAHIWKPTRDIILGIDIPPDKRTDIQLYGNAPSDIEVITDHFRSLGFRRFHIEEFHDMICDRDSFNPSPLERLAVKLREKHAPLYRNLELERGIEISDREAGEILKEFAHYGVVIDNRLASIAARYVTLPEIHIIGGVFTVKDYRGRGYAKAVTSALTREAVNSGAIAGLHVEVDNEPAIRTYTNLGYRATRVRTWIFANP